MDACNSEGTETKTLARSEIRSDVPTRLSAITLGSELSTPSVLFAGDFSGFHSISGRVPSNATKSHRFYSRLFTVSSIYAYT